MAFWTEAKSNPTRKYRFTIQSEDSDDMEGVWYWAKSINKPSYEIAHNSYQVGNHNIKYPGTLTWADVSIKIVDTGSKAKELYENLSKMGYEIPDSNKPNEGISKQGDGALNSFTIMQLDDLGSPLEKWTLYNTFVSGINFGDLSYSDDDLVEISIEVSYDYAKLE